MNNVNLSGRLGKEIELKKTPNGTSTVSFRLAVNDPYKKDTTYWINCVAWRQSADYLAQYANKGDLLGVCGQLQTRQYENREGATVYVTEVICERVEIYSSARRQESTNNNSTVYARDLKHDGSVDAEFIQPSLGGDLERPEERSYTDIKSDDLPFY